MASGTSKRSPVLTPQAEDFPRWYQDVIEKAELADNGPVRGTMVIRPYGYALWERVQSEVDQRIKQAGAENVYLPLLIPESYLQREAEHVEGFSPELAVVTHAGGKELAEPLVIRPTSETVFGELMAKWVQGHRDLPLLLNQWANVVRWEMRPRLFLRTTEFLWQEGHTAHATQADATAYARRIHLQVYRDFFDKVLATPVHVGLKSARERFAGAVSTLACEAMMGDGKALQVATSHEMGRNFATAFGITYSDAEGGRPLCWTTSWGLSTRVIGGLIMGHGDDNGLVVPPALAPTQVVILVVKEDDASLAAADRLQEELLSAGIRAKLDRRTDQSFGRRVTEWELKGVPVRLEVGPRDLGDGVVTLARRDGAERQRPTLETVASLMPSLLQQIQGDLLERGRERLRSRTIEVSTVQEAAEAARQGFARIPWRTLGVDGEAELAGKAMTVRCLQRPDGSLPEADDEDDLFAIVARSY